MSVRWMPRLLRVVAALGVLAAGWPAFAQRITDLPAATSVNSADLLAIVQMPGAVTRRTTVGAIAGATTYPTAANGTIISNISGATATPTGNTLTQVLNALACTAQGSILYKSASAWTCLAPGTSGHSLTTLGAGANPAWQASSGGSVSSVTYTGDGVVHSSTPTAAITSTGTLTAVLATQSANRFLGGPTSGGAATPTFRALVAADLPAAAVARGFTMPFNAIPTTGDPDLYQIPAGASAAIAASTVPSAICRVNPAATTTFLVKKWTGTSSASSTTLCTGSLSTSCVVSSCSISATTLAATNAISIETTAASADSSARITITVPWSWQ